MSVSQRLLCLRSRNVASILALAVVLSVPVIQLLSGPGWSYSQMAIDDWVYHGFFLHLSEHLHEFAGTYYASRLAWILPGYFAHAHLSPLAANLALRLYLYLMAVLSAFYLIRRTYGLRCALVSCLALACYPEFLVSIGWDYVDGAGVAYILLSLEEMDAATRALSLGRSLAFFTRGMAAGTAVGAAIHSNVFLVAAVPVLLIVAIGRTGWCRKIFFLILTVSCGTACLTIILGLTNMHFEGAFLFFLPSIQFARQNTGTVNQWYVPISTWIYKAPWLVLPCAMSVIGLVWIVRPRTFGDPISRSRIADVASIVLTVLIFVLFNVSGMPVLQFSYYASYMIPFVILGGAAIVGDRLEAWKFGQFVLLGCGLGLIGLLVGSDTPLWRLLPGFRENLQLALIKAPAVKLFVVLVVSCLFAEFIKRTFYATMVLLGAVAITAVTLGVSALPLEAEGPRSQYLVVDATSRQLGDRSAGAKLWFWHSNEAEHEREFRGISSTYLWGYRLLGTELPDTSKMNSVSVERGDMIALLTRDEGLLDQARMNLLKRGVQVSERSRWVSQQGNIRFLVSIVSVTGKEIPETLFLGHTGPTKLSQQTKTLVEYSGRDLVETARRNVYGTARVPPGGSVGASSYAFPSSSSKDHLATRYLTLRDPASQPIRGLEIRFVKNFMDPQFGAVRMIVQDQQSRTLYDSGTFRSGDHTVHIGLDDLAQKVRFTFLPNDEGYIVLPDKLDVHALLD